MGDVRRQCLCRAAGKRNVLFGTCLDVPIRKENVQAYRPFDNCTDPTRNVNGMDAQPDIADYPPWTRIHDESYQQIIQEEMEDGTYELSKGEEWWRDRFYFLESRGYRLRTRFRPGWTPQWKGTNVDPMYCPDSHSVMYKQAMDANRILGGMPVAIKKVEKDTNETRILTYLNSPERFNDPANHCVPLLDRFGDEQEGNIEFIVMPHLIHFLQIDFFTVGEVVDFMQQTLEALAYIHSQGVAHRDYFVNNIMLDGTPLYPNGYLPADPFLDRTGMIPAEPLRRSEVPAVRYYIIDFGLSTLFEDPNAPRLVTGSFAQDADVPELSKTVPYDPFKVDVFTLGNIFRKYLIHKFANLRFLYLLVEEMTELNPDRRPTAEEALSTFRRIISRKSGTSLRWRLRKPNETLRVSLRNDVRCAVQEFKLFTNYLVSRPLVLASIFAVIAGAALSRMVGRDAIFARITQAFSRLRTRR